MTYSHNTRLPYTFGTLTKECGSPSFVTTFVVASFYFALIASMALKSRASGYNLFLCIGVDNESAVHM